MTFNFHLTKYDYNRTSLGPSVPRTANSDWSFTLGSSKTITFTINGDRSASTWRAVINNQWAFNDTDGILLATATVTTTYEAPDDRTRITCTYNGNDITFGPTENLQDPSPKAARAAVPGVNYYVHEIREIPPSNLPYVFFTGFVEVYPKADII